MKHNIIFFEDRICLYGNAVTHVIHKHYLIQIVVYYEFLAKNLTLEIIDSNHPHAMLSFNGLYFTILLDPMSALGKQIQNNLLSSGKSNKYKKRASSLYNFEELSETTSPAEIKIISNKIISSLITDHTFNKNYDIRIIRSLKFIHSLESLNISAGKIYKYAGLSESQFNLLFKNNVGIPLRKYILWVKLYRSVKSILSGHDFTSAAHWGDFADSSHLAKTFKSNTGINLTAIFRNRRFIQVHIEKLP